MAAGRRRCPFQLSGPARDTQADLRASGQPSTEPAECVPRRWVQNECRGLGEADAPEVEPLLQRAAAALRARPVLFRYCAEEVRGRRPLALAIPCVAVLPRVQCCVPVPELAAVARALLTPRLLLRQTSSGHKWHSQIATSTMRNTQCILQGHDHGR